jgi:lysophospholipase L1-like esterase
MPAPSRLQAVAWLLALALLASLALNVFLARAARTALWLFQTTRLDPLGLAALPPEAPAAPPAEGGAEGREGSRRRVGVLLGDSRAAAWPLPPEGPSALGDAPPGPLAFVQRGVSGHTTAQVRLRYEAHVAPLRPAVVVLQAGVNDVVALSLLGEARRAPVVAACVENLRAVAERAQAEGAWVVLTTVIPPGRLPLSERLFGPSGPTERAVAEVNAALRALTGPRLRLLDAAALLSDAEGRLRADFQEDPWHVNAAGYRVLDAELRRVLAALPPAGAGR